MVLFSDLTVQFTREAEWILVIRISQIKLKRNSALISEALILLSVY